MMWIWQRPAPRDNGPQGLYIEPDNAGESMAYVLSLLFLLIPIESLESKAAHAGIQAGVPNPISLGYKTWGRGDCKALIQGNAHYCKSRDCKALVNTNDHYCESKDCKAVIRGNAHYCSTKNCKAVIEGNAHYCTSGDCKAHIKLNAHYCKSKACKAIIKRNAHYCP